MKNTKITEENYKLTENLIKEAKALPEKEFKMYLRKLNTFYKYSFLNQMIIASHSAINVKSYKQWKDLDRQVRKNPSTIWILAPIFKTYKKKDDKEDKEETVKYMSGCKSVPVYDIKDTVGKPLPDIIDIVDNSKIDPDFLSDVITQQFGVSVQYKELKYIQDSYSVQNITYLNSIRSEEETKITLIREISKRLLDECKTLELSSEILTFLISNKLDMEVDSKIKLQGYEQLEEFDKSMNEINKAFRKFMDIIDLNNSEEENTLTASSI